jgi:ribosomal protein L40E
MPEPAKDKVICRRCGMEMIPGRLYGRLDAIRIDSRQSLKGSPLRALVCPRCGYVELEATNPEALVSKDISSDLDDAYRVTKGRQGA